MIHIDSSLLIGKGYHRECYVHPEDENLCIKVVVHGDSREGEREQKYYEQLQKRTDVQWDVLPKFYGIVETDKGQGAVFNIIRDYTGEVSKTLEYYMDNPEEFESIYEGVRDAFKTFKKQLYKQVILTMNINAYNVLYQKINEKEGQLVIVDNIGISDFFPICHYSTFFARKKIMRKWNRFEEKLYNTYKSNKKIRRLLADISDAAFRTTT